MLNYDLKSKAQVNTATSSSFSELERGQFRSPMFAKVLFVIFVVSLIPLGGMLYLTMRVQQVVRSNVQFNLENNANSLSAQINNWTDLNLRVLRQAATHPDVISMNPEKQLPFLVSIENAYEWAYRVLTLDLEGYAVARSSGQPIYNEAGEAIFYRGDRAYFTDVIAGAPYAQQVLISRSTNRPALCLSVAIKSTDGNTLKGVLLECSFLELLSNAITNLRIGSTGFAMLLNEKGQLIAHGGNPQVVSETLQDYSDYPATAIPLNQLSSLSIDSEEVIAIKQDVGLGWTLIVQQDSSEAFAPLKQVQRNAIILYVISGLLIILVAFVFTRRLVRPLERLKFTAESISRGHLDVSNEALHRKDEIGDLAKAIERLRISVKMMLSELAQRTSKD